MVQHSGVTRVSSHPLIEPAGHQAGYTGPTTSSAHPRCVDVDASAVSMSQA